MAKPDKLLIPYADYEQSRFHHVGRYGPGNLFMDFVTGAFPGDWRSGRYPPEYLRSRGEEHKRWYAMLHRVMETAIHSWRGRSSAGRCQNM
jgi:hypothetical protein